MRFGQYEILARIAVGGMAEIYRGRAVGDEGFEKPVAIKRILPSYAADARFVSMLLTEARIHAALSHKNIVQIHDLGISEEGEYFIVLEYVDGRDLGALLEVLSRSPAGGGRALRLSDAVALYLLIEIGEGVHFAHDLRGSDGQPLGLVHRDISPSNVLISYAGEVKLSDFGLAKRRTDHSVVGSLKGKLAYMSPEQARRSSLDQRSDIFALGAVFFELITGRRLREISDDVEGWRQVASGLVPSARPFRPDLSPALDRLLAGALAPDPRDRFPDARTLVAAAREALEGVTRSPTSEQSELQALLKAVLPPGSPRPATDPSKVIRLVSQFLSPERTVLNAPFARAGTAGNGAGAGANANANANAGPPPLAPGVTPPRPPAGQRRWTPLPSAGMGSVSMAGTLGSVKSNGPGMSSSLLAPPANAPGTVPTSPTPQPRKKLRFSLSALWPRRGAAAAEAASPTTPGVSLPKPRPRTPPQGHNPVVVPPPAPPPRAYTPPHGMSAPPGPPGGRPRTPPHGHNPVPDPGAFGPTGPGYGASNGHNGAALNGNGLGGRPMNGGGPPRMPVPNTNFWSLRYGWQAGGHDGHVPPPPALPGEGALRAAGRHAMRSSPPRPGLLWPIFLALLVVLPSAGAFIHFFLVPLPVLTAWARPARLDVSTQPGGAEVYLDGRRLSALTPTYTEVRRDRRSHTIEFRKEGYQPARRPVRFDQSEQMAVTVTLQPESRPSFRPIPAAARSPGAAAAAAAASASAPPSGTTPAGDGTTASGSAGASGTTAAAEAPHAPD